MYKALWLSKLMLCFLSMNPNPATLQNLQEELRWFLFVWKITLFVGRLRPLFQAALTQDTHYKQTPNCQMSYQRNRSRLDFTKSALHRFTGQTHSSVSWLQSTLFYQEVPKHPSLPFKVRWRLTTGSTRLATVVTKVNQIGSLEHANRFIILNKGSFLKCKYSSCKQGPYVLYGRNRSAFWADFHNFVGISALLYKEIICYLELDMHFLHLTMPPIQL